MVTFLGISFYWYGLILGASIWLGWEAMAYQARRHEISLKYIETWLPVVILGGLVGARVYHVITDWPLYFDQPVTALYLWQGGLSVIGAVLGGGLVLLALLWWQKALKQLPLLLDLAAFGLPLAQALGRLGNYINQELYGGPSTLPWAIYIAPPKRIAGYETFSTFHPLFAYEMIAMLVFGGFIWWWDSRGSGPKLGSGVWFAMYLAYYATIRFFLDFLRIDTRYLAGTGLTVNQGVMLVVLAVALFYIWRRYVSAKA